MKLDGPNTPLADATDLILVTGPSGAGRTTAIHVLEDAGYEAIDNMPLSMVTHLVQAGVDRPLALGIDIRNRDFSVDGLVSLAAKLRSDPKTVARLLYLDCARDALIARFSETRRRHPLAPSEDAETGVMRELSIISTVADHADVVVDTTAMTVHDLKDEVLRWFGRDARQLAVSVQSFSFKRGVPRGLDMVFDVRFLSNPHWVPELRSKTGMDAPVRTHIKGDPRFDDFYERVSGLIVSLLPAYREEGRAHLGIGLGCTGGRHRSVAVTEMLAETLADEGWQVSKRHRELDRRSAELIAKGPGDTATGEGAA